MHSLSLAVAIFGLFLIGGIATAQVEPSNRDGAARTGLDARREISLTLARQQCIDFREVKRHLRDCLVTNFQRFGLVDGQTYYYALYCLIPNFATDGQCEDGSFSARYHQRRGLAIFVAPASSSKVRLLYQRASLGEVYYQPPEIIGTRAGRLLYLPIVVDGTGHYNASEYFLRQAGKWQPIESEEWQKDLMRRVPTGLGIWKGVWPDLKTMQATAGLYHPEDANCCPTAGTALIRLAIRSRRFVLETVHVQHVR